MSKTHVRSVRVREVIVVESVLGAGISTDPIRPIVQIFDLNGNEIQVGDYTKNDTP